jgi:hypothetical protein
MASIAGLPDGRAVDPRETRHPEDIYTGYGSAPLPTDDPWAKYREKPEEQREPSLESRVAECERQIAELKGGGNNGR